MASYESLAAWQAAQGAAVARGPELVWDYYPAAEGNADWTSAGTPPTALVDINGVSLTVTPAYSGSPVWGIVGGKIRLLGSNCTARINVAWSAIAAIVDNLHNLDTIVFETQHASPAAWTANSLQHTAVNRNDDSGNAELQMRRNGGSGIQMYGFLYTGGSLNAFIDNAPSARVSSVWRVGTEHGLMFYGNGPMSDDGPVVDAGFGAVGPSNLCRNMDFEAVKSWNVDASTSFARWFMNSVSGETAALELERLRIWRTRSRVEAL